MNPELEQNENRFKKLRRRYRAFEREGLETENVFAELLLLDMWLSENRPGWHRNYEEDESR